MATIKRRNDQNQCRSTRRIMTIILGVLLLLFTLRVSLTTLLSSPQDSSATVTKNDSDDIVILTLQLNENETVDIRIRLFAQQAPKAASYVTHLATNNHSCKKCTLYRGEPVPSYWGSEEYPDRYFNGGRWGPPYALVQGGLILSNDDTNTILPPPAESHNPVIERGMVAWAGGKGGPHFFIALARHSEWGHSHTVWGQVEEEDMHHVDSLVQTRPLVSTKPKQPPIVSNFVTPIRFTIRIKE